MAAAYGTISTAKDAIRVRPSPGTKKAPVAPRAAANTHRLHGKRLLLHGNAPAAAPCKGHCQRHLPKTETVLQRGGGKRLQDAKNCEQRVRDGTKSKRTCPLVTPNRIAQARTAVPASSP